MDANTCYISEYKLHSKCCINNDVYLLVNPCEKNLNKKVIMYTEGNKNEHTLHAGYASNINRETNSWILAGLLAVYVLILVLSKKYVAAFFEILFPTKSKNVAYSYFTRSFIFSINILALFSIFVITVFVYLFKSNAQSLNQSPLEFLAIAIAVVFAYVAFKTLCIKIIGSVSENNELKSKIYAIETAVLSMYGPLSGLFLIFCFLNRNYAINAWLIVISTVFLLLFLLKIFKITMIFINEKISSFFLILYLCAFEILPVWLIVDFL